MSENGMKERREGREGKGREESARVRGQGSSSMGKERQDWVCRSALP